MIGTQGTQKHMKTAKTLGIKIANSILVRGHKVTE
jgi:hypothetical protein